MKQAQIIPFVLGIALAISNLPAQTPTEPVRKVIATDAVIDDLLFPNLRTLRINSGGTFHYEAGAVFAGSASEFRGDIGLGTAALLDTGLASGDIPVLGAGGSLSITEDMEAEGFRARSGGYTVVDAVSELEVAIAAVELTSNRVQQLIDKDGYIPVVASIGGLVNLANEVTGTLPTGSIADDAVTNAKLANQMEATVKGRAAGAGTGDPVDLSANQVSAILDGATDPFMRSSALPAAPVQAVKSDTASTTSGSWVEITGLDDLQVTTTASNKVIIRAALQIGHSATNDEMGLFRLTRNGTVILQGDTRGSRSRAHASSIGKSVFDAEAVTFEALDTPGAGTHSYAVEWMRTSNGGTSVVYINRAGNDTDASWQGTYVSTLTAQVH